MTLVHSLTPSPQTKNFVSFGFKILLLRSLSTLDAVCKMTRHTLKKRGTYQTKVKLISTQLSRSRRTAQKNNQEKTVSEAGDTCIHSGHGTILFPWTLTNDTFNTRVFLDSGEENLIEGYLMRRRILIHEPS
jgi:uncharacterized membrane protein